MMHLDFRFEDLGADTSRGVRNGVLALMEFERDADFKPPMIGVPVAHDCEHRHHTHSHVIVTIEDEAVEEWEVYIVALALGEARWASRKCTSVSSFVNELHAEDSD